MRKLKGLWVFPAALVVAFSIEALSNACSKSETPAPTPTPVPAFSPAVCKVAKLPPGTPPICHDSSGAEVKCPNGFEKLPDCP